MKILVLGGTGVISRQIVNKAVEAGYDVTVFNRGMRANVEIPEGVKVVIGDRKDTADFEAKMKAIDVDVVIDMISFNVPDVKQLLDLFGERCKQIIVTSSSSAYDRPYKSYPVSEDKEVLTFDDSFAYGFNKAEMDRYLQSQMGKYSAGITIIRPCLTFGEGTATVGMFRQNKNIARRISQGKPVVMLGEGVIPWSFTFAPDLAKAYVLACCNENTYNDHFHVTNTEVVMWEDLYRAIGKIVGKEPNFVYVPSSLLRKAYPTVCTHLNYEKVHFAVLSNEKFQKAVPEYKPEITLEEGMKIVMNWWDKTGLPYDEEKEKIEDDICAAYYEFEKALLALGLE
ncbi:MAG: NAD-dependent epimerase/dehydratase family protein [Clostridia bacterium]